MRSFHPGAVASLLTFAAVLLGTGGARGEDALAEVHFKPRNHALGDVHPYFHEGVCFLYYLKPGTYESALACSADLLKWTGTPIAHAPVRDGDWTSPYYVLGVFRDKGADKWRSFFGQPGGGGRIASSESKDLIHWSCAPKEYHIPAAGYYRRRRDPFVFRIPETGEYGCVMTTRLNHRPEKEAGAVSLATSGDLKRWTDHGPILDPGDIGEPECPQMFQLGKRWYLLASIYDRAVGRPVYWMGDKPAGPWSQGPHALEGKDFCAGQIGFDGEVPLLFGWIPLEPSRPGRQTWGGHLALAREIYALPDGRLATRLPAKLAKNFERLCWETQPGFSLGTDFHQCRGQWRRLAAEVSVRIPAKSGGVQLDFGRSGKAIVGLAGLCILDASDQCWSQLDAELPADQAFRLLLFVENGIVELFVADRYSLAARVPAEPGEFALSLKSTVPGPEVLLVRTSAWTSPP